MWFSGCHKRDHELATTPPPPRGIFFPPLVYGFLVKDTLPLPLPSWYLLPSAGLWFLG
jgi:hypothetical protein